MTNNNHNQKDSNIFDDTQETIEYAKEMEMENTNTDYTKDIDETTGRKENWWFLKRWFLGSLSRELAELIYNWLFVWIFNIIKENLEKTEKKTWIIILDYITPMLMLALLLLIPIFLVTVVVYLLKTGLIWIYNNAVYFIFGLLKLIVTWLVYVVIVIFVGVIASILVSLSYVLIKKILIYLNLIN